MIFVVGTGRSGTSTVARILHFDDICCMGHKFPKANEYNPRGYYEDYHTRHKLQHLLLAGQTKKFIAGMEKYHKDNHCTCDIVGYKKPELCDVDRKVWVALNPEAVYWAIRDEDLVIDSLERFMKRSGRVKWNREVCEENYHYRMAAIKKNLGGLPFLKIIDFGREKRSDQWVRDKLYL